MKNGIPAFPVPIPEGAHPTSITAQECRGMSLRDYFAAAALNGMLSNGFMPGIVSHSEKLPLDYVGAAYELADKLLAERDK